MQILKGKITTLTQLVVEGNTVFVFTLMKKERDFTEWADEVYDAVFVLHQKLDDRLSSSILVLATASEGSRVSVHIDSDNPVPVVGELKARTPVVVSSVEHVSGDHDDEESESDSYVGGDLGGEPIDLVRRARRRSE